MKTTWKNFIPKLMAKITGKERYLPEIKWSDNSWVHNIFRLYESVFWRRYGVKAELTSTYNSETRQVLYQAHSFEAVCALVETYVRNLFTFRLPVRIYFPRLVTAGDMPNALPFLFAVAFDASSISGDSVASFAHTCTGSDLILIIGNDNRNQNTTAIAYNSVSATQRATQVTPNGLTQMYLYSLASPSTGANNIVVTGGSAFMTCATSYSGASGTLDSITTTNSGTGSSTLAASTTVVAANCWLVGFAHGSSSGSNLSSDKTDRRSGTYFSATNGILICDSNGTVATGSQTINFTLGGGSPFGIGAIVLSIAPVSLTTTSTSSTTSSSTSTTTTSSSTSSTTSTTSSTSTTTTSSSTSSTTSSSSSTTTTSSSTSSTTSSSTSVTTTSSSTTITGTTTSTSSTTTTTSSSTSSSSSTTTTSSSTSSTTSSSTSVTTSSTTSISTSTTTTNPKASITDTKRSDVIVNTRAR